MDKYERYCLIRDKKSLSDSDVAKLSGVGKSTFSDWKSERSAPKGDKMGKIAKGLGVTIDFMNGDDNEIICKECGYSYNPLDDFDCACHERAHKNILDAKEKYPFLMPYEKTANIMASSLIEIRKNNDNFWDSLENYLQAEFSRYVSLNYEIEKEFNYDNFCDSTLTAMINKGEIPDDKIDAVKEHYKIRDNLIIIEHENIETAKNNQITRILRYLELLKPELLDIVEKQIKALSDTTNIDNSLSNNTIVPMPNRSSEIEVNAAHSIPDASEKDKKHDDDIMDDENF